VEKEAREKACAAVFSVAMILYLLGATYALLPPVQQQALRQYALNFLRKPRKMPSLKDLEMEAEIRKFRMEWSNWEHAQRARDN